MTDREKVIKGLEHCIGDNCNGDKWRECEYSGHGCIDALLEGALALLKAQEPVKPVVDVDTWTCGKCGHTLEHQQLLGDNVLFHEQYNYCPECGRAVKWE